MNSSDSGKRCDEPGCRGRYFLSHITRNGYRVWRCFSCGAQREEFYKAVEPDVQKMIPLSSDNSNVTQLVRMVLDDEITLSQVDPTIRSNVERAVIEHLIQMDTSGS